MQYTAVMQYNARVDRLSRHCRSENDTHRILASENLLTELMHLVEADESGSPFYAVSKCEAALLLLHHRRHLRLERLFLSPISRLSAYQIRGCAGIQKQVRLDFPLELRNFGSPGKGVLPGLETAGN